MSMISTHVLDMIRGRPAANIEVRLEFLDETGWSIISAQLTSEEGRVADLLGPGASIRHGQFRLIFQSEAYFRSYGQECFFPEVTVCFRILNPEEDYHVPLLLGPYSYSVYRGAK